MVISLFTFSASLCKCHYSMLSDDNNKQKEQRVRFEESMQHFCQEAERDSHFSSWIDLSSLLLVKKNQNNNEKVKSRTVSQVNV